MSTWPRRASRTSGPWPSAPPTPADRATYVDAEPRSYWLDGLPARDSEPPLDGKVAADLCIVGGGFTGLWAALHAKLEDPEREVALLEARTVGFGASARNGGFFEPSLTHGLQNGLARFGEEIELLERLGGANLRDLLADLGRYAIDCDLEPCGTLLPIIAPYQDMWLEEEREIAERFGYQVEVFADAAAMRAEVCSPTYRGGIWTKHGGGILDPGKLLVGLLAAALRAGVRVYEQTPALRLEDLAEGIAIRTPAGSVRPTECYSLRVRFRRCCARSVGTWCRYTTTSS